MVSYENKIDYETFRWRIFILLYFSVVANGIFLNKHTHVRVLTWENMHTRTRVAMPLFVPPVYILLTDDISV